MVKQVFRAFNNLRGWHTSRKIVVIESDDWGCWRTRDARTLELLSKRSPHILSDPYNLFDTLETDEDLEALFDALDSVRDRNGCPAILTANTIVANPDFRKIKADAYANYHYIPLAEEIKNEPLREKLLLLIKQGMERGLYQPQLHGREHLNVNQWLNALQKGHKELLAAFEYGMFGVQLREKISLRNNVMASFDFEKQEELVGQGEIVKNAQLLFQQMFGFNSSSFIAPSYIWHPDLEPAFVVAGIQQLQGLPYQYIPNPGGNRYREKVRYTGMRSQSGLVNLIRNVHFEPSLEPKNTNVVEECVSRIKLAFQMRKPAVISSHRLNFIGSLEERNRLNNLKLFRQLLKKIIKKWPDLEFVSSDNAIKEF